MQSDKAMRWSQLPSNPPDPASSVLHAPSCACVLVDLNGAILTAYRQRQPTMFEDVDGTYIRMLFPHRIDELDEVLPFIRDRLANESAASGWLLWGVLVASKSQAAIPNEYELIGISGFEGPPSVHGQVEIGYAITPAFRGQGIATEAVGLLVSHAMRRGARRIVAEVYPFKRGSIRVLEKTGFQLMGQGATRGTMRFAVEAEEC